MKGKDAIITARIPAALVGRLDDWAVDRLMNRSEAVRDLVDRGLTGRKSSADGLRRVNEARARALEP